MNLTGGHILTGRGGSEHIKNIMKRLETAKDARQLPSSIDLTGYSRGGRTCVYLAQEIFKIYGDTIKLKIFSVDPTGSPIGPKARHMNIPPNVQSAFVVYSEVHKGKIESLAMAKQVGAVIGKYYGLAPTSPKKLQEVIACLKDATAKHKTFTSQPLGAQKRSSVFKSRPQGIGSLGVKAVKEAENDPALGSEAFRRKSS